MSSFIVEEKVLLGLGFSIFTEKEYELKTTTGKIFNVKTIKLSREGDDFHFTCLDSDKNKYNIVISVDTKKGVIKGVIKRAI